MSATAPEPHPIRAYRARHGLSLEQIAERAGINFTGLSRVENGRTEWPSAAIVARLAQATDGEVSELDIVIWHFARVCRYVPAMAVPMTGTYAWGWLNPEATPCP